MGLHIGPNGKRWGFNCPLRNRKGRIKLVQDGELGMTSPYEVRILEGIFGHAGYRV